jgi:DNA-binding NarL/FixJ family response regulator
VTDAVRVLIADDHPSARAGVRAVLEAEDDFIVCAEAGDAQEAVEVAMAEHPDICLLDVHMPGSGISAAATISERLPDTAVVMLTVSGDEHDVFDALQAGAAGYLLKDTDPDRIPVILRAVLNGEGALPRRLVGRMIEEFRDRGRRRVPLRNQRAPSLTGREREVLELMGQDLTTAQIAKRLFISPVTVRRYVGSILKKLHVPDRESALRLVREN